jgi:hypothetical protein
MLNFKTQYTYKGLPYKINTDTNLSYKVHMVMKGDKIGNTERQMT